MLTYCKQDILMLQLNKDGRTHHLHSHFIPKTFII